MGPFDFCMPHKSFVVNLYHVKSIKGPEVTLMNGCVPVSYTHLLNLPPKMREAVSYMVKGVSDHTHKELQPREISRSEEHTYKLQ